MTTRISAAATAALVCATLSACGSSGDKKLSRDKLADKAGAICGKAEQEAKQIPQPKNITNASDASAYFEKLAPVGDRETSSLKDLNPDSEAKDDWNSFVSLQGQVTDLVDSIRDKAKKNDVSGLRDLTKVESIGERLSAAAKKVGITKCG